MVLREVPRLVGANHPPRAVERGRGWGVSLRERLMMTRNMLGNLNHLCLTKDEAFAWLDVIEAAERVQAIDRASDDAVPSGYWNAVADMYERLDALAAHLEREGGKDGG